MSPLPYSSQYTYSLMQYFFCRNANCCLHCDGDIIIAKRAAEEDVKEGAMSKDTKTDYVDLFRRFAAMTDSISSDLAMFLYCMLN